jgi:hypothetical protein
MNGLKCAKRIAIGLAIWCHRGKGGIDEFEVIHQFGIQHGAGGLHPPIGKGPG